MREDDKCANAHENSIEMCLNDSIKPVMISRSVNLICVSASRCLHNERGACRF